MMPASSVSALVFAHPQSEYFAVGKVDKDQVRLCNNPDRSGVIVWMLLWRGADSCVL
jgi:hypothetical protein